MQNLPTYNASLTLDAQVAGDSVEGGVQLTIQGGVITIGSSTIAITEGQGEVSGIDRMMIQATAVNTNGQSFNLRMEGLAALYNGATIAEISGNAPFVVNGTQTNLILTYLATIS